MTVTPRFRYKCTSCDNIHEGFPALTYGLPDYAYNLPEDEKTVRCKFDSDICVVDKKYFFVRCTLEYPVVDSAEVLSWGLWGSLSENSFEDYMKHNGEAGGPYFCYLSNSHPAYPGMLDLECAMHPQPSGWRPRLQILECDHPLYREQRDGISFARALELTKPFISWCGLE